MPSGCVPGSKGRLVSSAVRPAAARGQGVVRTLLLVEPRVRVFDFVEPDAVGFFARAGWVLTALLDADGVERLRGWVDEVAGWVDEGPGLHHRELTDDGPQWCRTEDFVPHHAGLRDLLTAGPLLAAAGALLGEPAVLYKEKVNAKLPGGAGYAPHQDAPAYRFVDRHVSCLVAVDDATPANGCLEVVSGRHGARLPVDARGCIRSDVARSLHWEPVAMRAGQALWFHSCTPHRSGPNRSASPRRALYPTYNAAAEGDLRDRYYRQKRAELAAASPGDDRVPVSLIGDFLGRPVR
jgi:hypothetical protein